jgi:hypothetical protein
MLLRGLMLLAVTCGGGSRLLLAQTLQIRVANAVTDTAYMLPNDTVPVRVVGKTLAGGTVTPTKVAWFVHTHCLALDAGPTNVDRATMRELDCGLVDGWVVAEGLVSGAYRVDSVYVKRPGGAKFAADSVLGICLASTPSALFYAARDTVLVLATFGAGRRIALTDGVDRTISFGWQGGAKLVQFNGIACMPAYRAMDVTRSGAMVWTSTPTDMAPITTTGLMTWKAAVPFAIRATWRGATAAFGVQLPNPSPSGIGGAP